MMTANDREPTVENASQRRLSIMLDRMPTMVGYWDSAALNVFANPAYADWIATTTEQMRGMPIREVLGEDLYAQNLPFIEAVLAGDPQHFDGIIVDPGGSKRFSYTSYVPDIDDDGRVQGFFVLVANATERATAELAVAEATVELERRANTDSLTGLANLSLFEARFAKAMMELGRARPGSRSASLILIDLDGFKPVNDRLDCGAGSEVLLEISERLQRTIRGTDMVARVGGGTFIVLATRLRHENEVSILADRIKALLHEPIALPAGPDGPVVLSASMGVVILPAGRSAAVVFVDELGEASRRMHEAQRRGGNCWVRDLAPRAPFGDLEPLKNG